MRRGIGKNVGGGLVGRRRGSVEGESGMAMTEKEVLEVIEQARREGRTVLSLSDCGLTSLPAAIGGCGLLN